MASTYTTSTAHDTLVAEGYAPSDVDDVLNSMVSAGFELPQPDEGDYILTSDELSVLRDQLNSAPAVVRDPECPGGQWCRCAASTPCVPR